MFVVYHRTRPVARGGLRGFERNPPCNLVIFLRRQQQYRVQLFNCAVTVCYKQHTSHHAAANTAINSM